MPINSFLYPGAKVTSAYEVANSCRFNRADGPNMTKTPGSAGDLRKWTWSCWVKRGTIANGSQTMFNAGSSSNTQIRFDSDDTINFYQYSSSYTARLATNQVFRDVAGWYHIVAHWDTDNGTAGDRMKLFVNGTEVTSFSADVNPSQNLDSYFGASGTALYVGDKGDGAEEMDGYLAEVCFIDGQNLAPSSFGEFDSDSPNIWKPKDVSGLTFGTNGFYLDFEDSSNLGNDKNGGTDLTENNITATDQTTDTPTNNFCTLNPLNVPTANAPTFSEGNTRVVTPSASGGYYGGSSTIGVTSGKWYFEFITDSDPNSVNSTFGMTYNPGEDARNNWHAGQLNSHCWAYNLGDGKIYYNNTAASYGDTLTTSDILGMAVDLDNHKIYWAKNNTWQNSGNPESGSTGTGAYSLDTDKTYFVTVGDVNSTPQATIQVNFGNPYKALSSAASDANGYGAFEYEPPDGYYSLCTKNLAEFGG